MFFKINISVCLFILECVHNKLNKYYIHKVTCVFKLQVNMKVTVFNTTDESQSVEKMPAFALCTNFK